MAWAYFDTSALVKRYVDEAGRGEVLRLLRRYDVVTSAILPIEVRSALRRRLSDGTLDAARVTAMLPRLASDRAYWTFVEIGTDLLTAAETLVATHPIRTLDAIHVASAQLFRTRLSIHELLFVSADTRQIDAARAVGMAVKHLA